MKKLISLVIVLTTLMLGATGCARSLVAREEEEKEAMLEYMYDKYGVEFQVDSSTIKMTTRSYIFRCSLKGTTDENEKAQITVYKHTDDREEPYEDTYFPILISEKIKERVEQALDGKIEFYKAYVYEGVGYNAVDKKYVSESQLDQYLEEIGNNCADYSVSIFIHNQESDEENEVLMQEIVNILRETEIGNPYLNIFCMDASIYEERTKDNSEEIYENMNGIKMYRARYSGELFE